MDKSVEYATKVTPEISAQILQMGEKGYTCSDLEEFLSEVITRAYQRGAIDSTRSETAPAKENQ